ncbi:hypothetical protein PQX77_014188 [Marasmius sp. AFHP31]|nr:hypothetical protein PQX77_014188 [Marasmius sp. AFHP31]
MPLKTNRGMATHLHVLHPHPQRRSPPPPPPPLLPPPRGALKDRIAKFEKKGGVPVPRGSFGLGAPPIAENGPAKRRGELYGNRIPSSVKSHTTGPAGSGGLTTQITGPSPPSWSEARHSFMPGDGKLGLGIQIPGLEYGDGDEDTGGFAPPDSALGQPQGLPYAAPSSPPPPPVPELPLGLSRRVASDSGPRRAVPFSTALDLARKAEGESQGVYHPRSREGSLSPQQTGSGQQALASLGSSVEEAQGQTQPQTPTIVVAEPEEIKVDEQTASTETSTPNDAQAHKQSDPPPVESSPAPESAPAISPPPKDSTADVTASTTTTEQATAIAPTAAAEIKVTDPPPPAPLSGDESDGSTATVQDTRVISQACDDDDDADLFVKPIKRKSPVNAVGSAGSGDGQVQEKDKDVATSNNTNNTNSNGSSTHTSQHDQGRLMPTPTPSTPSKGDETPDLSPVPSPSSPSFAGQSQMITVSRPESMAETSSPGHVSFAQRISPVTSRGVPVYLPGKSGSGSGSPTSVDGQPPSQPQPQQRRKESVSTSEFGVVESSSSSSRKPATTTSHLRASTDPYDPTKTANRKSTFSAVVHGKVRETQARTLPASLKNAPLPPGTPVKNRRNDSGVGGEPMSPGLGELAMLMQQSALLESRLIVGDYPDESGEKEKAKERERQRREKETERARLAAEAEKRAKEEEEANRLSRSNTRTSQDSDGGRMRKMSLKKVFGMGGSGKSKHETSTGVPLETIPATPPHNASSFSNSNSKDLSRSRSMELLSSSSRPSQSSSSGAPPLPPSITLEPPPPKPTKAHSIHAGDILSSVSSNPAPPSTSTSASTSTSTSSGMDSSDDIPPTPPPKSPSTSGTGSKYLSSIRRFASSSSRSGAYPPRHSVSTSSDDSVTVVTPPDYSPDFTGTRTMLETRTRTRSGSRSGKRILIGDGPGGEGEEDRASVVSGSGSAVGGGVGLQWPSSKSPRKGGSGGGGGGGGMSRAASFAEKMFSRGRTKSSASSASSYDTDGYDGIDPPKVSTSMLSPATLPDMGSRSPSLHELILSEPLPLSIPEMNEPRSAHSQTTPILARPPSWISTTSSTGTGGTDSSAYSRLFDKDFFDSFPAVPETTPTTNHTRVSSSSTLRHA